ncbi:hypothetical protein MesoLj131c_67910 (plasmid) [Mesorhizobium sp. 131-3-5]|nr:hypothetical protein MesoLj131c_67910 [Mesorhizobium sp. 131-3-5]
MTSLRNRMVELRQIKYFVGVSEAGSFTRAAAQLNVAKSALSLYVRQMEEGFGTRFLVRERTGAPTWRWAKRALR